jgi:long-chain fatty acid transport protein
MSPIRPKGVLLSTMLLCGPLSTSAQGFGVNEISSCALARGFAATAAPCDDGSFIFWNPAAGTSVRGTTLGAGGAAVRATGAFTSDGSRAQYAANPPIGLPPHLFFADRTSERLTFGVGAYVPYGLTTRWQSDFPGRFLAQRASIQALYVQPTVSYVLMPQRLSIGGGPVITRTSIALDQPLDLSTFTAQAATTTRPAVSFGQLGVQAGTEFAQARLSGSAYAFGVNVGALWNVDSSLTVGARYLSAMTLQLDAASARFTPVATNLVLPRGNPLGAPAGTTLDQLLAPQFAGTGALINQPVRTAISLPDQLAIGVAWTGLERTTFSADVVRVGWQAFREIALDFSNASTPDRVLVQDFTASWSARAGVERRFTNGWVARGGASWVQSPAPAETVTPLLPDRDRRNLAVGAGIPLSGLGTRWRLDASYLLVDTDDRRGRVIDRTDRAQKADQLNTGVYSLRAQALSLTLRASW